MRLMSAAISVSGLRKSFGRVRALDGLDLSVETGEVHGFLGPNGSGKSTTIRILLGLLRADGGSAEVLGGDPWRDVTSLHRRLAYVPGDVTLWPALTGGEVIDLLGRLRGGLDPARRARLLERFDLDPTRRSRAYSKGNRQKVALIAALASDVRRGDQPAGGAGGAARRPQLRHRRQPGAPRGRQRPPRHGAPGAGRRGGAKPRESAADTRGALPPPLPARPGRDRHRVRPGVA